MNEKELIPALEKALSDQLTKIKRPLAIIALLQLADEFYTKDERHDLYARYQQLRDVDAGVYRDLEAVRDAMPDADMDEKERFAKHGEDRVRGQRKLIVEAIDRRKFTMQAVFDFESEHPIIVALFNARSPKQLDWATK